MKNTIVTTITAVMVGIAAIPMNAEAGFFSKAKDLAKKAYDNKDSIAMFTHAATGNAEKITALIAKGVDPNCHNKDGYTPLMVAAGLGKEEAVKALIAGGADVDAKTGEDARGPKGFTALMAAAAKGQVGSAEILIANGATVDASTTTGITPLVLATFVGNAAMVQKLVDSKANVNARVEGMSIKFISMVVSAANNGGGDLLSESDNYTVLQIAEKRNFPEIAQILKQAGAQ